MGGTDLSAGLNLSGTTHTNAGDYTADAWTFTGNVNYNDASGTVHDLIAKAEQTINFGALTDKLCGDSPFTVNATASSSLPVNFIAAGSCSVSGNVVTIARDGLCTITAQQDGNQNYNPAPQVSQSFTITNPLPVVTITGPVSGTVAQVGAPVLFTATFTDNALACSAPHTYTWKFDNITMSGPVPLGTDGPTGSVSLSYSFAVPGVYMVNLTITDTCAGVGSTNQVGGLDAMVVIYDPYAGFVTGGGWINSPPGAFAANASLVGKANFGFVSKYKRGQSIPTGETEFQFKAGDLNFHSSVYEWLVIAGAKAQYKGSGTINGAGDYFFMLTAIDGQINGGGNVDKFRIKIWNRTTGAIIYDNQMGMDDNGNLTTQLGGGSIVIHN